MVIVSTMISPILLLTSSFSRSIATFCSSKVVGRKNTILSSSFLYSGISCFSLETLNPPSVSMKITFLPAFAVSIAASSAMFVFPAPAGPYIVVIASSSNPPWSNSSVSSFPVGSLRVCMCCGNLYKCGLSSKWYA